jgi:CheY-like chemotaxis protein
MTHKVLVVEDSDHKRIKLVDLIMERFQDTKIVEARSFNSAARAIDGDCFDLIIMDMSLPTYDRTSLESGGKFRALGGRELARKVVKRGHKTKIVFFTQYDTFSGPDSHTLSSLEVLLSGECGSNFHSLIYFDSSQSGWRDQILAAFE